ncbi:MAG TPA: heavy-metal-associated domain-containing protein, partial [Methylomirabilota bacterium]|nr:heavy-metal-associated domain-containing protein [Methylomirabilota bacterium]
CASAVTKAVKRADPAAEVAVDLPTGRVSVETAQPRDRIVEAIEGAGYEVAA